MIFEFIDCKSSLRRGGCNGECRRVKVSWDLAALNATNCFVAAASNVCAIGVRSAIFAVLRDRARTGEWWRTGWLYLRCFEDRK